MRDEEEPLQVYETHTILSYKSMFQTTKVIKANEGIYVFIKMLKSTPKMKAKKLDIKAVITNTAQYH